MTALHSGECPEMTGAVDLFAGAGGWEALSGLDALGIEIDESACAIREAAGLRTLRADVAALDPMDFAPCAGMCASPPCVTFSSAGRGGGRGLEEIIRAAITDLAAGRDTRAERRVEAYHVLEPETAHLDELPLPRRRRKRAQHAASPVDRQRIARREARRAAARRDAETSLLVVEPLRWALELHPRWIALEQVPPVLPLWEAIADVLREHGYSAACDVLSSERYGVPQTRQRAVLIASLDRVVTMPAPTHQRYVAPRRRNEEIPSLFDAPDPERIVVPEDRGLLPWVSMADALGFGMTMRPSVSVLAKVGATGGHRPLEGGSGARATLDRAREDGHWEDGPAPAPAPTVTSGGVGSGGGVEVFAGQEARQRAADAARWVQRSNYSDGSSGSGTAAERGRTERPLGAPSVAITSKGFQWQRSEVDDGRGTAGRDVPALLHGHLPALPSVSRDEPLRDGDVPEVPRRGESDEAREGDRLGRDASEGGSHDSCGGTRGAARAPGGVEHAASVRLRAGTNANDVQRSLDEPAPTIRYGSRLNDVSWVNDPSESAEVRFRATRFRATNDRPGTAEREAGEPAPTLAFGHNPPRWVLRSGQSVAGDGRAERSVDDPSLTVIGRFDLCEWTSERPATSVNCDPRIAEPGRHDPEQNGSQYGPQTVRVTLEEAGALQSFPEGWPWCVAGTRTAAFRATGNALPALLAVHILKAVM